MAELRAQRDSLLYSFTNYQITRENGKSQRIETPAMLNRISSSLLEMQFEVERLQADKGTSDARYIR